MSARVVGETCGRPLTTLDTVATDTPATDAIVARVVRSLLVVTKALPLASRYASRVRASSGQVDRSRQPPVGADDPRLAGEPDLAATGQVYRRVADEYLRLPGSTIRVRSRLV